MEEDETKTPNAHKPGRSAKEVAQKTLVSDCALDGPSAADRQPSPGAEMIDRGKRFSHAVFNKCHLLLLNQKTTNMYLPRVDSSPCSCSRSPHAMHLPSYQPRIDSTIDLGELFSFNLAGKTFSHGSTTPHTQKIRILCAEDGRTSLRQPPRRIRNRGTDRQPHLTTWRVEKKQHLA
jgi:hypothetical protein